jgi:hypothetical protein
MPHTAPIHAQNDLAQDPPIGVVKIEDALASNVFDLALTPIVVIGPGEPGKISSWLAHPRTDVDIRPRSEAMPHRHIGVRPPILPPEIWGIVREVLKRALAAHEENGTGPFGIDKAIEEIERALATEENDV